MTYFQALSESQKASYLKAHLFFSDKVYEKTFTEIIAAIASLQSWLEYFVKTDRFDAPVSDFFCEAVNDAILAYSFARVGTWRPGLQSLRSTLENTLYFLYYKDHPVELQLWARQKNRINHSELQQYLRNHPSLCAHNHQTDTGLELLDTLYSDLSKSVHGTVAYFRMTSKGPDEDLPSVHVTDPIELSRFKTTVRRLIEALNQLLVAIFSESLQGGSLPSLRQSVARVLSTKKRAIMKQSFNVTLRVAT